MIPEPKDSDEFKKPIRQPHPHEIRKAKENQIINRSYELIEYAFPDTSAQSAQKSREGYRKRGMLRVEKAKERREKRKAKRAQAQRTDTASTSEVSQENIESDHDKHQNHGHNPSE